MVHELKSLRLRQIGGDGAMIAQLVREDVFWFWVLRSSPNERALCRSVNTFLSLEETMGDVVDFISIFSGKEWEITHNQPEVK